MALLDNIRAVHVETEDDGFSIKVPWWLVLGGAVLLVSGQALVWKTLDDLSGIQNAHMDQPWHEEAGQLLKQQSRLIQEIREQQVRTNTILELAYPKAAGQVRRGAGEE